MNDRFWIHSAELQRATTIKSTSGQVIQHWQPVQSGIQCYIRGLSGNEIVAAEKVGYKINARMYCDKSVPAKKDDRITSDGKTYEIDYVNEQIATHLQIDLKAIE